LIFWCFCASTALVLFLPWMAPWSPMLAAYDPPGLMAYSFVSVSFLAFLIGYGVSLTFRRRKRVGCVVASANGNTRPQTEIRTWYLVALSVWALIGLYVAYRVIVNAMPLAQFMELMQLGGRYAERARIQTIGLSASKGGLPGLVRMLTGNCNSSLIITVNLLLMGYRLRGIANKALMGVIVCAFLGRLVIMVDRMSLLMLIPFLLQWMFTASRRQRWLISLFVLFLFFLGDLQSLRRGYSLGILGFMVQYTQSGMVNLELMMETFNGIPTFGLMTVLSPVFYVFRAFGTDLYVEGSGYSWGWNYFQNAYGYFYHDFLWGAPLIFLFGGAVSARLDKMSPANNPSMKWKTIAGYRTTAMFSYAALSFISVPAFYGIDFYLILGSVFLCSWLEAKHRWLFFAPMRSKSGRRPSGFQSRLEPWRAY
jgi:hypothetical protein